MQPRKRGGSGDVVVSEPSERPRMLHLPTKRSKRPSAESGLTVFSSCGWLLSFISIKLTSNSL
jgi:hypothetical protein